MQDELKRKLAQRDEVIAILEKLERGRQGGTASGDLTTRRGNIDDTDESIRQQQAILARLLREIADLEAARDA